MKYGEEYFIQPLKLFTAFMFLALSQNSVGHINVDLSNSTATKQRRDKIAQSQNAAGQNKSGNSAPNKIESGRQDKIVPRRQDKKVPVQNGIN